MKVEEIRRLLPECDIYALEPDATHIIVYNTDMVSNSFVRVFGKELLDKGISALMVGAPTGADPLVIYAIKKEPEGDNHAT